MGAAAERTTVTALLVKEVDTAAVVRCEYCKRKRVKQQQQLMDGHKKVNKNTAHWPVSLKTTPTDSWERGSAAERKRSAIALQ
jgi:hypothetical protein